MAYDLSKHKYKPLPSFLTILKSPLHGLGLFPKSNSLITSDYILGLSHILNGTEIIRTPLGGFINHSDDPNCKLVEIETNRFYLVTSRYIEEGEELTLNYEKELCGIDNRQSATLERLVKDNPNDYELGEKIRQFYYESSITY